MTLAWRGAAGGRTSGGQRYILPEDVDLVVRSAGERYEYAMRGMERSAVK